MARFDDFGERWFLKDPAGKPFFVVGTQVVGPVRENYGYYRAMVERWPSEAAWGAETMADLKGIGINALSVAVTTEGAFRAAGAAGMSGFEFLGDGGGSTPKMTNAKGKEVGMPDPFEEAWRKAFRSRAEKAAAKWNSQDNIIGYFVNNEMMIDGRIAGGTLVGCVYSRACGQEFVRWLKERYRGDIARLNQAWYGDARNKYHASFEAVLTDKPDLTAGKKAFSNGGIPGLAQVQNSGAAGSGIRQALYDDFHAFAVHAVEAYAGYMVGVCHELMPDKLAGTNRFQGGADDGMLAAWKDYDFIAWNAYPIWLPGQTAFTDAQLGAMRHAYEVTGKPLLITEWGNASYEARLPGTLVTFPTFREQGKAYQKIIGQLSSLPFVVGEVHFAFEDLADTEKQAWGIVDERGFPRPGLVEGMAAAHAALDAGWRKAP